MITCRRIDGAVTSLATKWRQHLAWGVSPRTETNPDPSPEGATQSQVLQCYRPLGANDANGSKVLGLTPQAVKSFGPAKHVLVRLAALGIAPRVRGQRDARGDAHAVKQFRNPSRRWLTHQAKRCRIFGAVALFLLAFAFSPNPAHADIDAASVQRSIDRGVAYLRKMQNDVGGWEEFNGQPCGMSALCTLAMLNCGVSKDDQDIVRAMRYLRTFEPDQTYSVALQTLVYCQLGAAGDLPRIRRNVQWLVEEQIDAGGRFNTNPGGWTYNRGQGSGDPSNSQFAVLALGAAADRGIEVEPETFQRAIAYWTDRQKGSGGWSYQKRGDPTGSMTCAGIASVIIARGRLSDSSSKVVGDNIQCCGGEQSEKDPVEEGLNWLARNFTVQGNPSSDNKMTYFYYLYALERVGRLSGRRFIGNHDWYREGAERIVALQDDFQGFWPSTGPLEPVNVTTSFSLLFLSKGKRQVVAARLQHGKDDAKSDWQQHPDGLRQLVRQVERDWRRDLTFQTIDSKTAKFADLLQTPVLIISGSRPLEFTDDFVEQLRSYIDQGGTIFFESDSGDGCGPAGPFARSVQKLSQRLVDDAVMEKLPPDHPVWFAERKVAPAAIDKDFWMYGVQACCRTSIFFSPRSLSCRWELADLVFRRQPIAEPAKEQIKAAVGIGENMIAYATGRELKDKLESRFVIEGSELPEGRRGVNQLATLAVDAGGQEARRALRNAATLIAARVPVDVSAAAAPVKLAREELIGVDVLWVHGRTEFQWTRSERELIAEYLDDGGVILGSAICGEDAFAKSFRREIEFILGDGSLKPVPPDHAVMNVPGSFDLTGVTIRTPSPRGESVSKRIAVPQLEMAQTDGEVIGVFFSPLDLSCALESPNSIQCPGYSTEDAAKIVANLVVFSLQQ